MKVRVTLKNPLYAKREGIERKLSRAYTFLKKNPTSAAGLIKLNNLFEEYVAETRFIYSTSNENTKANVEKSLIASRETHLAYVKSYTRA